MNKQVDLFLPTILYTNFYFLTKRFCLFHKIFRKKPLNIVLIQTNINCFDFIISKEKLNIVVDLNKPMFIKRLVAFIDELRKRNEKKQIVVEGPKIV